MPNHPPDRMLEGMLTANEQYPQCMPAYKIYGGHGALRALLNGEAAISDVEKAPLNRQVQRYGNAVSTFKAAQMEVVWTICNFGSAVLGARGVIDTPTVSRRPDSLQIGYAERLFQDHRIEGEVLLALFGIARGVLNERAPSHQGHRDAVAKKQRIGTTAHQLMASLKWHVGAAIDAKASSLVAAPRQAVVQFKKDIF